MSLNYSTYGAAITDAYGTKQPPALARESNFPGPDGEPRAGKRKGDAVDQKARSLQLDALKQRIHGGGGLSESKVPLGAFEPQTSSGQASSTKQSTAMDQDDQAAPAQTVDEPLQSMPPAEPTSAGGFPLDYASAAGTYTDTNEQRALLEKLNYAIHLLEKQQDRRTATVTEELLLYALLGMFIICVLDNFARVGKYVR